ncbi:MAG: type VI secretion system tip protein VgrG [Rhodobacteraceae bacterium]|nr:type VI secretion system tip protein VgrG [Paracoccaceae bacterium]
MSGSYTAKDILLKRAIVREGLSKLTETTIEFQSKNKAVKLEDIVGRTMTVHLKTMDNKERIFTGTVISVENQGFFDGYGQYVAEVRPWFWLLTRTQNCRIFQEKTVIDIIDDVLSEHGFSDVKKRQSGTYKTRSYCVQYRETDYDFLCRLMEEEGLYFYFDNEMKSNSIENLVIADGVGGHSPVPINGTIEFIARDDSGKIREDHIAEWAKEESLTRGMVTLEDYNFETPTSELKVSNKIEKGSHSHKKFEIYDYPGHYRDTGLGDDRAKMRMQAEAIKHKLWRGASSVRTLGTGYTFKLKEHPEKAANGEYLVTDATHYLQVNTDYKDQDLRHDLKPLRADFPEEMKADAYACIFGAIPKADQYRAPLVTKWPTIAGLHTATVVGKDGEEIWTDKYGRIKVQFHWDRVAKEGKLKEKSSCWVRVVTPWSGKSWGFVAVPRMGQEVVIQFEEGDPDRPICTGMLYHKETMPPYQLPENQTQVGIRTDSSKDVKDAEAYNELMFDDLGDKEMMRVQAQKDHQMLVKNKSVVTIGLDAIDAGAHDDEGSLSQVVRNHVTETILEGDHYETIETGKQEIKIDKGDQSLTIAKGDQTIKIETGSKVLEIKTDKTQKIEGKHTKTITGDDTTTVKTGNMKIDVKAGKVSIKAAMEIKLEVGGSSIKIDNSGVTIKGPIIKIAADGMAEMKSPMTTVKGDGMLTLKGGMTLIN